MSQIRLLKIVARQQKRLQSKTELVVESLCRKWTINLDGFSR